VLDIFHAVIFTESQLIQGIWLYPIRWRFFLL